ncbi:hypothetical protein F4803DRAFT_529197 [Xylaria telfairii]|nr:hypothetical protein F4803DRAFT_529197 [Xylaria telfairii]
MIDATSRKSKNIYRDAHPFHPEHSVHRAVVARGCICVFGRIRRTAVDLYEIAGDTKQEALIETLGSLCRLSYHSDALWSICTKRSQARSPTPTVEPSSDDFEADLCVASIYLGRHAHVEHPITQEWKFCDWDAGQSDIRSDVFGSAFIAASLRGDISMIRLLF